MPSFKLYYWANVTLDTYWTASDVIMLAVRPGWYCSMASHTGCHGCFLAESCFEVSLFCAAELRETCGICHSAGRVESAGWGRNGFPSALKTEFAKHWWPCRPVSTWSANCILHCMHRTYSNTYTALNFPYWQTCYKCFWIFMYPVLQYVWDW